MSKERELLKKICEDLDADRDNYNALCNEIEDLLAQPESERLREHIDLNKEWYQIGYESAKQELRDHFAGLAMQGLINRDTSSNSSYEEDVEHYYSIADAMIAERKKRHQESHEELLCQDDPI